MVAQIELPVAQGMELRKPSTMDLLQVVIQNNAAIDVIERLAPLQLDQRKLDAEVGFNEELNICQREVQTVVVDSEKTGPSGKKWATYKALDKAICPIYTARGLSFVRFGPRATRMRCGRFSSSSCRPTGSFFGAARSPSRSAIPSTKRTVAYIPIATPGSPFSSLTRVVRLIEARCAAMAAGMRRRRRASRMSRPSLRRACLAGSGSTTDDRLVLIFSVQSNGR